MVADIVNGDGDVLLLIAAVIAGAVAVVAGARRAWEFAGVAAVLCFICLALMLSTGP